MAIATLIGCVVLAPRPVDTYTLSYFQESFVVRGTEERTVISRTVREAPRFSVAFRRGQTFAVWDDRGLTIRRGKKATSTRLSDYPVSPKLFSRDEIRENLSQFQAGTRKRDATSLSGARRVGTNAYFLIRWEAEGRPWLEALVSVDLTAENPKPQLVGKFNGFSVATRPVDDRLGIFDGKLAVVVRLEDGWGLSTYDPLLNSFSQTRYGGELQEFRASGLVVDRTSYGTTLGSQMNLHSGIREVLFETRGSARFVDDQRPRLAVLRSSVGPVVRNLETGAERLIPDGSTLRRQGRWLIAWTGGDKPRTALLIELPTMIGRARWASK